MTISNERYTELVEGYTHYLSLRNIIMESDEYFPASTLVKDLKQIIEVFDRKDGRGKDGEIH